MQVSACACAVVSCALCHASMRAWTQAAHRVHVAGALSGLVATLLFNPLHGCLGLVRTGGSGIGWQLCCLLAGVVPVLVQRMLGSPGAGSSPLLYLLLSGLVASRLGLWLFDLAVLQLQQELVPAHELGEHDSEEGEACMRTSCRSVHLLTCAACCLCACAMSQGTVSGVQVALQSLFEVASFVAGCIASRPELFPWLMAGSCGAVATAAALYGVFAYGAGPPAATALDGANQALATALLHNTPY